jgi:protein SCO1/2
MTPLSSPISRRRCLAQLLAGAAAMPAVSAALAAPSLPSGSVYQLDVPLTDQHGRTLRWPELRGTPVLASMFYSSCEMVCPMIFETLQLTLREAGADVRAHTRVAMISFDPVRDTVEKLRATAQAHKVDDQWVLARADEAVTRQIAAVLGVQYRRLASGEFNHSTSILLLDAQGRIAARSGQLGKADPALLQALRRVARG